MNDASPPPTPALVQAVEVKQEAAPEPCDMLVASTSRASRAARSPSPSEAHQAEAWETATRIAAELEAQGLERIDRQPVVVFATRLGRGGGRSDYAGSAARPAPMLSHVFSLQRPIESNARESSFLSYQSVLPLESTSLAAAGMRSNSVRASVVHKARKTQGGGQQTTRNNLQDLSASWAGQAVSVAIAIGVAEATFGKAANPGATCAASAAPLVDGRPSPFPRPDRLRIMTSSTRLLPHALPTRLVSHNFLTTMQGFATSELEAGAIRSLVPQQVTSLRAICNQIVDKTDGVSIWAAWVLLVHMLSDPRLRRLVQASPISDSEVAVAYLFTNYARAEVTRRARADQNPGLKNEPSKRPSNGKARATAQEEPKKKKKKNKKKAVAAPEDDPNEDSSDDNEECAEGTTVEEQVALQAVADKQTLSLKRKRPPCSGVVQVSGGVLDYWSAALSSEYASILKLMITQSKALANQASIQTLTGQAPPGFDVERNALLVNISSTNAVKSAEALSSLVVTTPERVPKIVTWRCRDVNGKLEVHTGVARSQSDASNTTIHATRLAPDTLQDTNGHHVALWSLAIRNGTPHDASTSLVPGVVEGVVHHHLVSKKHLPMRNKHHKTRVLDVIKQRTARSACDGSLDVALTGVARGFLVFRSKLVVGESQVSAGKRIAERMRASDGAARERARDAGWGDFETLSVLSEERLAGIDEPFATPASNLTLALEANEQTRVLLRSKCRRGDPCRHVTGVISSHEMAEAACEEHDRPQALLPIVDCRVEFLDADESVEPLPNRRDASLRTTAITLTVCGDSPVRLVELLDRFARGEAHEFCGPVQVLETLALLHGGVARASELSDIAASISAGHVNSSISCAKRILVGDLNMRLYLTLYQVYRVGTSNVPRSFETTAWSGAYPAGFDIGTSGGIGIRASSVTADKRNHGKLLMDQKQVDEWCREGSKTHYIQVNPGQYAAVPREVRGVPHATIPGVHAYLDDYANAMERARALLGIEERRTVDSLQCITLGPFAERQPPHVSEQSDPTVPKRFRNPDDAVRSEGRAFQVDATCEDVAITREPLVPCVAITSPQDCIFGQSQPFLTSVIGAIAALDQIARCAYVTAHPSCSRERKPEEESHLLYVLLKCYYTGNDPPHALAHIWAAQAIIYLNAIFTCGQRMADHTIVEAHAIAVARCAKRMRDGGSRAIGAPLKQLVSEQQFAEAEKWWAPFVRKQRNLNVWVSVQPLLVLFARTNGSLDLPLTVLNEFWTAVDGLIRSGSWLHHSPDGMRPPEAPSPLEGVRAATQVRAEHVTPTLVGHSGGFGESKPATACILGVLPMGLQQLAALLQGAANDERVVVQYKQNFSFLIFRPSAAPDILTSKNKERSSKAISCVNVEGDEAAFGSRADKMVVCKLHREAWRDNLDYVKPLCLRVCPPRPDHERARGDRAAVDFCKERKRALDAEGLLTRQQIVADETFTAAVLGP